MKNQADFIFSKRFPKFFDIHINKSYDCYSKNYERRVPYIYTCINGNAEWIIKILDILAIENACIFDVYYCLALIYSANNSKHQICKYISLLSFIVSIEKLAF